MDTLSRTDQYSRQHPTQRGQDYNSENRDVPTEGKQHPNSYQDTEQDTNKEQSREDMRNRKEQMVSPTFRFGLGASKAQNKKGLPNSWKVLGIIPPSNTGVNRSIIIPMMFKKRWITDEEDKTQIFSLQVRKSQQFSYENPSFSLRHRGVVDNQS